jgi:hypothetical protein
VIPVCFLAARGLRISVLRDETLKYAADGEPHPSESLYHLHPADAVSFGGE